MVEKIKLLKLVARGLATQKGWCFKPDNVLLSSTIPCEARIADFGLSMLREPAPT